MIVIGTDQEDLLRRGAPLQTLEKINHETVSQKVVGDDPGADDPRRGRSCCGGGLILYDFKIFVRVIAPESVVPASGEKGSRRESQ
jgi:hypothetical protein